MQFYRWHLVRGRKLMKNPVHFGPVSEAWMTPRSLAPKVEVTPPWRKWLPYDRTERRWYGRYKTDRWWRGVIFRVWKSFRETWVWWRSTCYEVDYLPRRIFKGGEGEFETKMSKQFPDRRWRAALQEEWWKREGRKSVAHLCKIRRGKSTHPWIMPFGSCRYN